MRPCISLITLAVEDLVWEVAFNPDWAAEREAETPEGRMPAKNTVCLWFDGDA
jgi:hypothetical protein